MSEPSVFAWLPTLDAALRGALLGLLALLGLNQLRLPSPRRPVEHIGMALAVGLSVQVIAQSPQVEAGPLAWWRALLVGIAMGNAALFWLFARTLCDDDFEPSRRHALVWCAVVAAGFANLAWLGPWCWSGAAPGWGSAIMQAVFAVPLLFGLMGVGAAASHWRDDLVEQRRWLRAFIVVGGSLYTLGMVLVRRTTVDGRLTPAMAAADAALLVVFVAATAWMLLRPARTEVVAPVGTRWAPAGTASGPAATPASTTPFPKASSPIASSPIASSPIPSSPATAPAVDPLEDRLATSLDHAMRVERLYRDPELSVAGLAERLQVPEYRLRRLINQRLGHRNFSAFLNGHRLAEVRDALADPAKAHLPVLTLALEAGFGSIGPFNRAFKAETGLTPSDFRRRAIADS